MVSPRVRKLADQIKVIVAQMLERRVKDPRLGFVTITDVRLTGDTREATVFYTVLGIATPGTLGEVDLAGTQAALASATGLIRSQVGRQLGLRHTPSLQFILDAIPESAQHIEDLLARARQGDAAVAAQAAGAQYAGDADPYRAAAEPDDDEPDDDEPDDDEPDDDEPDDDEPDDVEPDDDEPDDDEPDDEPDDASEPAR